MIVKIVVNVFNYSNTGILSTDFKPRKGYGTIHESLIYTNYHIVQEAPTAFVIVSGVQYKVLVVKCEQDRDLVVLECPISLITIKESTNRKVKESTNRKVKESTNMKVKESTNMKKKDGIYLINTKKSVKLKAMGDHFKKKSMFSVLRDGDSGSPIYLGVKFHTIAASISKKRVYTCGTLP